MDRGAVLTPYKASLVMSPVITSPPNLSLAQPMSTESFGQVATVVPLLSGILAAVSKKSSGSEKYEFIRSGTCRTRRKVMYFVSF